MKEGTVADRYQSGDVLSKRMDSALIPPDLIRFGAECKALLRRDLIKSSSDPPRCDPSGCMLVLPLK